MIRRALLGALVASALLPAVSQAAVTRPIQAFDTPQYATIWTPRNVPAQVGDRIEWRLTQPGNTNAATHDIWLVRPGGEPQQLGASYISPTATADVDVTGTYQFYCSIHGGLTPGGMNGQIVVGTENPGAPVDPGTPWTDPDWEDPEDDTILRNPTLAPTIFEEGDTTAPTLSVLKVTEKPKAAQVKVNVSEAGQLTLRLKRAGKVVTTLRLDVNAGDVTTKIKPPKKLLKKERKYRLQIWATDMAEIESSIHTVSVTLGG